MNNNTHAKGQVEITQVKEIGCFTPIAGPSTELYCIKSRVWVTDKTYYHVNYCATASLSYEENEGIYEQLSYDPEYSARVEAGEDIYDIVPVKKAQRLAKENIREYLITGFTDNFDGNKYVDDAEYRAKTIKEISANNSELINKFNKARREGWIF